MTILLASVVDATVVMAIALAGFGALRRRSAAARHAVLAAGIVAATLVPVLELIVPQVAVLHWNSSAPALSSGVTLADSAVEAANDTVDASAGSRAATWPTLMLLGWAAGSLIVLAGLLTGFVRLRRVMARCTPVREGRWRDLADQLSAAAGVRRRVEILQSSDASLLIACGSLRPKIILPAGAEAWDADRQRIVLAHELAHVRRLDGTMQLAGELLRAVHWFNPLIVLACRQLRQQSEHACDDAVLNGGIEATEYATHLLGVARHVGRSRRRAVAPAIAHLSTLERRIAAMLNRTQNRQPLTRTVRVAAAAAAIVVVLPLTAATVASTPETVAPSIGATDVTLAAEPSGPPSTASSFAPRRARAALARPSVPAFGANTAGPQALSTISGSVLDQTGAALPGVQVTLASADVGDRTIATDANGRFAFADLQPASYELVARLSGFAMVSNVFSLTSGTNVRRVITMPLGSVQETITIACTTAARAPIARRPFSPRPAVSVVRALYRQFFPVLSAASMGAQAQEPGRPIRVGGNIQAPRKLKDVRPACPVTSPGSGMTVILSARIGIDGHVNDVKPLRPVDGAAPLQEFTQSALDAVRRWEFTPTLLNGQPVDVNMTVTLLYR